MTLLDPALRRRAASSLLGCLAVMTIGLVAAPPATAHPFGDPQTLEVSVDQGDVSLRWRVGGSDDLTALALHLGLLPSQRVLLDGAVLYDDGDGDVLAAAPEFAAYLLDHVQVAADGRGCTGEVLPAADLAADGAVLRFDCGETPAQAVVTARMLTDLHPDYRTLATGPGGQRAVYGSEEPEHTWSLSETSGEAGSAAHSAGVQLGSVVGVVLAGAACGAFLVGRRGRRDGTPTG